MKRPLHWLILELVRFRNWISKFSKLKTFKFWELEKLLFRTASGRLKFCRLFEQYHYVYHKFDSQYYVHMCVTYDTHMIILIHTTHIKLFRWFRDKRLFRRVRPGSMVSEILENRTQSTTVEPVHWRANWSQKANGAFSNRSKLLILSTLIANSSNCQLF